MSKANQTVLEIDLSAITHNYTFLKSKLAKETQFLAVVKAFAYGSDAEAIAKHLESLGVDYFAVAYTSEGIALRKVGIRKPILVLHPQPVHFKSLIENCLEPSLYNARVLNSFIEVATSEAQTNYPVHLKFNTGLNRLGFFENDVEYLSKKLEATSAIKVISLFSHLAASEDLNEKEFTIAQIDGFKKIVANFESQMKYLPRLHLLNTSGVLNYADEAQFDMVRCGIGLYGFGNDPNFNQFFKNVMRLKTVISQIHSIEPNESVGYNRAFKATGFMKTATLPIGHADGIHRAFGNGNGYVQIQGQKAPIIGNVCMDMIMVDITNISCNEGDEVLIFDHQETVNDLAERANTISYELLTALSQRIQRKIIK